MSNELFISGLLIILVIYIGVTLFLTFGKNIPLHRRWLFSKDRKKRLLQLILHSYSLTSSHFIFSLSTSKYLAAPIYP